MSILPPPKTIAHPGLLGLRRPQQLAAAAAAGQNMADEMTNEIPEFVSSTSDHLKKVALICPTKGPSAAIDASVQ